MRSQIDAKFYPHIIDSISDELAFTDPKKARLVCKSWCKRVDTANATWLAVDTCVPGIKILPATEQWVAGPESYSWEVYAVRQPTVVYQRQSLNDQTLNNGAPLIRNVRDIELAPSLLDLLDPVDWLHSPVDLPPADTVRFQVERYRSVAVGCGDAFPHTRRIIFSDGPYSQQRSRGLPEHLIPSLERLCCLRENCGTQHTQRLVLNARTPAPIEAHPTHDLSPDLDEVVVVFHGWRVVRGYDPARLENYHSGDPTNDIRGVILTAIQHLLRVTIVNSDLCDLQTGERRSNVTNVRSRLQELIEHSLQMQGGDTSEMLARLQSLVEWITLKEYRERVGDEEFKIETMTDPEIKRLVDRRG